MKRPPRRRRAAALAALLCVAAAAADAAGGLAVTPKDAAEASRQARTEMQQLDSAIGELRQLAASPAPDGLDARQQAQWTSHSQWIESVVTRLSAHVERLRPAAAYRGPGLVQRMTDLNLQYLQLQRALDRESRHIAILSDALKTRHDAVRKAISNLRV